MPEGAATGSEQQAAVELPSGGLDWLAPARLYCSQREGGDSTGPWAANNLGHHVGDAPDAVQQNRDRLLALPDLQGVQWLNQIHGTAVRYIDGARAEMPSVDAVWTDRRGIALAILTADCLPVALADAHGEFVGAAHAGWRGLCAGVLDALISAMPVPVERLQAFIGPAIGKAAFEVGEEVVRALAESGLADFAEAQSGATGKYQVDLAAACRQQLTDRGVVTVGGGHWCTYTNERFYSWRRETHRAAAAGLQPVTGRQATLVWLP